MYLTLPGLWGLKNKTKRDYFFIPWPWFVSEAKYILPGIIKQNCLDLEDTKNSVTWKLIMTLHKMYSRHLAEIRVGAPGPFPRSATENSYGPWKMPFITTCAWYCSKGFYSARVKKGWELPRADLSLTISSMKNKKMQHVIKFSHQLSEKFHHHYPHHHRHSFLWVSSVP